jgi:TolA-binding protein
MHTNSRVGKTIWTIASGLLVLALTAAAFVAAPAPPAFADDGTPPSAGRSRDRGALLERAFEREKDWLARQDDNLGKAEAGADKLAGLIEKAKANGVDTRDLEAALAQFRGQIGSAKHAHDEAVAILDAHAGFNGGGKVTDAAQALETVKGAGSALREAAQVMTGAAKDLRAAVQAWREAHPRPQPATVPNGA